MLNINNARNNTDVVGIGTSGVASNARSPADNQRLIISHNDDRNKQRGDELVSK